MDVRNTLIRAKYLDEYVKPNDTSLRFNRFASFIIMNDIMREYIDTIAPKGIELPIGYMCNKLSDSTTTDRFKEELTSYIGEENTETFLNTYKFILKMRYENGTIYNSSADYEVERYVKDKPYQLGDLYCLIILFIYSFIESNFNEKDLLFNIENFPHIFDYMVRFESKYKDIPTEEKKNIIGSIWNCIVDIVSMDTLNNTLKGGE